MMEQSEQIQHLWIKINIFKKKKKRSTSYMVVAHSAPKQL